MARKINYTFPELVPEGANPHPQSIKVEYTIRVITPLFGGGSEVGINDPVTLIRPSSIRGHLRFWWRATRGARFTDVRELRQREGEIWGTTENPSPVEMKISVSSKGNSKTCVVWNQVEKNGNRVFKLDWNAPFTNTALPYVLFPFQSDKENRNPAAHREDIKFTLTLWIPNSEKMDRLHGGYNQRRTTLGITALDNLDHDIQKDIEAAVWAWVNFGGIGARTRRGCGALYCEEVNPKEPQIHPPSFNGFSTWLKERAEHYDFSLIPGSRPWPIFPEWIGLKQSQGRDAVHAWDEAVGVMQRFRQEETGRKARPDPSKPLSKNNLPGRSYWPEAETIRNFTNRTMNKHARIKHIPEDAFPRAEFGLPIIFHFQGTGDPDESELYPKNTKRMASPIILRPLAFGDGSKAVPMVLRLSAPQVNELELKKVDNPPKLGEINIRRPELANYKNSPMGSSDPGKKPQRSSSGSALEAFIAYVQEPGQNFKKVFP